jgi:zinc transport system ATP-binding protein
VPVSQPPVEMRSVGVSISGRPILSGVDLTIQPGEVVAVLGANGSGKSTLIKAMLGLVPTHTGSATLFGQPIGKFKQWQRIGYVPQHSALSHGVPSSVKEIVASGRVSRRRPFLPTTNSDRDAIRSALAIVDLEHRADRPMTTLSGGQQQRALIARALAGQPELLIMDEPNAGVDLHNQQAIADSLRELASSGTTLVLVLHELGPFRPWIQRCVVLSEGRVVHEGSADSIPNGDGVHHHHHEPNPIKHPSSYEGLIRGDS